jgi:hypothetical protein
MANILVKVKLTEYGDSNGPQYNVYYLTVVGGTPMPITDLMNKPYTVLELGVTVCIPEEAIIIRFVDIGAGPGATPVCTTEGQGYIDIYIDKSSGCNEC